MARLALVVLVNFAMLAPPASQAWAAQSVVETTAGVTRLALPAKPALEAIADAPALGEADAFAQAPRPEPSLDTLVGRETAKTAPLDPELECMAKVVHHEAANQPLQGQLAVAQLILNRLKSEIFPKTVCAVVNQPGQFFRTGAYRAPRSDKRWIVSVAIARVALEDAVAPIVPGALFYHAAYVKPSWSHKRVRLAQIGAHIFYR